MRVTLNGLPRELADGCSVAELLELEGEPADHVVVEVNGLFVPLGEHATRRLAAGDRIEVILPAFGG